MANEKISALPAGTTPITGEELIPAVQGGQTVRIPASELQGPAGEPGAAGLSAYEVAVSEGFVGTEAEWLESLVGPEGPQGPAGSPGGAPTWDDVTGKPATFPPGGGAGGVLSGNYPNPGFAVDMATQGELDTLASSTTSALAGKVDAVGGKGLSTEDYTSAEKAKLAGIATGATANSSDATLLARANHTGTQAISTVTGLQTALDGKVAATEKGAANGVATLGSDSKILAAQLPAIAITDTFVVASQAAMLALTAERGDIAVRSDLKKSFALSTDSPGTLADWVELQTPTDAVLSVAGRTGAVTLTKSDVGLSNVDNTADATLLARANHTGTQLASTISDFAATVRSTVLTGLSTATNAAAVATDTVLEAIGKLQAQITGYAATATTFTNKRINPRVTSETSSATPTINTDNADVHRITALAVNVTSFTTNLTGTPVHGQGLLVEITGTAARTLAWGASFEASTIALPTTTVTTAMLSVAFVWNSATSKWRCIGVA